MNNKEKKFEALTKVLSISQSMQQKADTESWDELIDLEQQRQPLLDSIFPIEYSDNKFRIVLEKIIEINKQLEQQCLQAKGEVQQQLQNINGSKKALTAYQLK